MLNETLSKVQTDNVGIRACRTQVANTGIAKKASANATVEELAKQRFQRMRRRRERALSLGSIATGWVARMA